jgi:hypothetical protein
LIPFSPSLAYVLAIATGVFGILFGLLAAALGIYYFVTGPKDQLGENIEGIKHSLVRIEKGVASIQKKVGADDDVNHSNPRVESVNQ